MNITMCVILDIYLVVKSRYFPHQFQMRWRRQHVASIKYSLLLYCSVLALGFEYENLVMVVYSYFSDMRRYYVYTA